MKGVFTMNHKKFSIVLIMTIVGLFFCSHAESATYVGSDIVQDTYWTLAQSPYVITNSITVAEGKKLTIEAGVIVKIALYCSVIIDGTLTANGTSTQPIYVTSILDDTIGGDTNGDGAASQPARNNWGHIHLRNTSTNNLLNYVVIRYGGYYTNANLTIESSSTTVSNATIEESSKHGIYVVGAAPSISGCILRKNSWHGIYLTIDSSNASLTNNTVSENDSYPNAIVFGEGTITKPTVFRSQNAVYVIRTTTVDKDVLLTVDPGTVVKISQYCSITIKGTLSANGTQQQPVYFTSILDDSIMGDTNGDSNNSAPNRNNWGHMFFTSESKNSVLNYAVIRYGGYYTSANIYTESSSLTISNSTIEESSKNGICITNASPSITANTIRNNTQNGIFANESSTPTITYNSITGNGASAIALVGNAVNSLIHSNIISGKCNGITLSNGTITTPITFKQQGGSFVMDGVTVSEGAILTIDPSVVVKISRYTSMTIDGTLIANGTSQQPIYFTSILDDTVGGDTNGDGNGTLPDRNNWGQIYFSSTSKNNKLDNVVVRYGGYYTNANLVIETSSLTLSNSVIEESSKHGVYVNNASPIFTGNTIKNNTRHGVYLTVSAASTSLTQNTLTGNGLNPGGIQIGEGIITKSTVFSPQNAAYVIGNVTIAEGVVLTILPGTIVKIPQYTSIWVNGSVKANGTADNPIYLTSILDDTGGDTNGDGSNSQPARNNWGQIHFTSASRNNVLNHVRIRYGGYYTPANLLIETSSLSLTNSIVEEGSKHGIQITNASPTITDCTIRNNSLRGIYINGVSNPTIATSHFSGNGWDAILMEISSILTNVKDITVSQNGSNSISIGGGKLLSSATLRNPPGVPYKFADTITIPEHTTLKIEPGVAIKMALYSSIEVDGSVNAIGTASAPIYITSILDDSVIGDTNNDGDTKPARNNWGWLRFSPLSRNNILQHVVVRYGGYYTASNVKIETSSLTMSNCIVEEGSHHGVYVTGASPIITGCTMKNNSQYGLLLSANSAHTTLENNTVMGNALYPNGIVFESGTIDQSLIFRPQNAVFVFGNITIKQGTTLMVEPGTIVKIPLYTSLTFDGTLIARGTSSQPIYFTSIVDDSVGGDTNGTAAVPARNDWGQIRFTSSSEKNVLDNVVIRYGGYYAPANLTIETSSFSITNSTIEEGSHSGIYILEASPLIMGCGIRNNSGHGIQTVSSHPIIMSNTIFGNSGNGIYNQTDSIIVNARYNYWGDPTGPKDTSDDTNSGGWYNPNGKGDTVTNYVAYQPWLDYSPHQLGDRKKPIGLTDGVPYQGTITPLEIADFSFDSSQNRPLLVELTPQSNIPSLILDGKLGSMVPYPSLGEFSVNQPTAQGKYELLIYPEQGKTYYFSVFGHEITGPSGQYTITAKYIDKYISDVSPRKAGNAGNSTLVIKGLGFINGMRAELNDGNETITSSEIVIGSPFDISVWFNLSERPLGKYNVSLVWPDGTRKTLTAGFEITQGVGSRLEAVIEPPPAVRPGRNFTAWLEYKNAGDADMWAPLFTVKSNAPISLDRNNIGNNFEIQILGVGKSARPNVLRIGESRRIPIYFNAETPGAKITFNLYITDDNFDPVDWYAQKQLMTPPDLSQAEWNDLWPKLISRLGNTWAQYLNVLRKNAAILSKRGIDVYDIRKLIRYEAKQAMGLPVAAITGFLKDQESFEPLQGVSIKAVSSDGTVVVQTDSSFPDGHFVLEELPDGNYGVYCEGYELSTPTNVSITAGKDTHNVVVYAKKISPYQEPAVSEPQIPNQNPVVVSDGNRRLFLVWERGTEIWWAVNSGTGWNTYGKISGAIGTNPVLAYGALVNGNPNGLFCAWETGDTHKTIQWAVGEPMSDDTIQWSSPQPFTSDENDDFGLAAIIRPDGQAMLLWLQKDGEILSDDTDIYYQLLNLTSLSTRNLEIDDNDVIITHRGAEKCTEIKWPPGDIEGLSLPKWIPIIGGKSGFSIFGKVCGEDGCTVSQAGKVGVEAKIGEKYGVSGEGSIQAKWSTDKKKCIYVFNEGNFSASFEGKVEIPTTPVPIVIVGVPVIGVLPVGTGQIVGTIKIGLVSSLIWKSNFPGLPTNGTVDITLGGELKGKLLLASGFLGGDVSGGLSGTIGIKTPPFSGGFKEYCVSLSGTGSIGWGFLNRNWTKKWGSCADARSLLRNISERDLFEQGNCGTIDGVFVCEQISTIKQIFSGTNAVYEGLLAFGGNQSDLVNDGVPSSAVSSSGEIIMAWAKDADPNSKLGAKIFTSVYQSNRWQNPVEVTPTADFNSDVAVAFDSNNTPFVVWARASSDNLTYRDSTVEEILSASDKANIYYSRRIDGKWTVPSPIAEIAGKDEKVAIAKGPNGVMTVVWQNRNGNGMTLYASMYDGTKWSDPVAISTSVVASSPKIAYVSEKPTVTWAADTSVTQNVSGEWVIFTSTWDGSAWTKPERLNIQTSSRSRSERSIVARTLRSAAPPKECCDKKDDDPKPPDPPKKPAGGADTPKIVAVDPNEKVAVAGVGDQKYVTVDEKLTYKVYFENKSTAEAPAQEVFVTDYLDSDLDWATIRVEDISFGNVMVTNISDQPMLNAKVTIADYRDPSVLWHVAIRSTFESKSGCLKVSLHTLDPETGDLPEDAYAGLLPPNDSTGRGEGNFTFTIYPKKDRPTGTVIKNAATIIFDTEAPIVTNEVMNVITDQAPNAKNIVPAVGPGVTGIDVSTLLGWSACDFASTYDVYLWKAGQPEPTTPTASNLKSTFYDPEQDLSYGTVYKWKVTASNVKGSSNSDTWTFTTAPYPYLRDAIALLSVLCGVDLGDISYIVDINGDGKRGLMEVIYFLQKAAQMR